MRGRSTVMALLAFALVVSAPSSLPAKERVKEFLDRLETLEMHDVAILYLESLRSRHRLAGEVTLALKEGTAYLATARATPDPLNRERLLETARDKFREFLADQPRDAGAAAARAHLGSILVEQGKMKLARSRRPSLAAHKETLILQARKDFEEAEGEFAWVLQETEESLARLAKLPGANTDIDLYSEREDLRTLQSNCRTSQAALARVAAQTYDEESGEWRSRLESAANQYESIYFDSAGGRAYLNQSLYAAACCRRELKQREQALALCQKVLDFGPGATCSQGEFLVLAMQCARHPAEGKWQEAASAGRRWLEQTRDFSRGTHVALAVRWELAQSLEVGAAGSIDPVQRAKFLEEARQHARVVAQSLAGEHSAAAAAFLRKHQGPAREAIRTLE